MRVRHCRLNYTPGLVSGHLFKRIQSNQRARASKQRDERAVLYSRM